MKAGRTDWATTVLLAVLWGSSYISIEVALGGFDPLVLVFLRVTIAASTLFLVAIARGEKIPRGAGRWGGYFAMGLVSNVLPFCLIAWGQQHTTAGTASMLTATVPLIVVAAGLFRDGRHRPRPIVLTGLAAGTAGVITLVRPGLSAAGALAPGAAGQLSILAAAACYAASAVLGKRFADGTPAMNAAATLACASVIMFPVVLVTGAPVAGHGGAPEWTALLVLAELSSAAAYLLYFRLLATVGTTQLSLVSWLVPLFATLLGCSFLGETVDATVAPAAVLILLGIFFIDLADGKTPTRRRPGRGGGACPAPAPWDGMDPTPATRFSTP
jgi:drug/metabolite transporter (DMT)-like permease